MSVDGQAAVIAYAGLTPSGIGLYQINFSVPQRAALRVRLGKGEPLRGTAFTEVLPAFSLDVRWLAYQSNESGIFQVYVRPFPGPGGKWQVPADGGKFPRWSNDGREVPSESTDGRVMSASFTARATSPWKPEGPKILGDVLLRMARGCQMSLQLRG
jgi:hypothetical protein